MTPTVLVTGAGGPAGRSLIAQFVDRKIDVVGVDMARVVVPGVDTFTVPAADHPSFLWALLGVAHRCGAVVMIPTVSEELGRLAIHRAAVAAAGLTIVVGPGRSVVVANDKWLTYTQLTAADIAGPLSALPSQVPTAADVTTRLGVPFVSKPRVGRGGRGIAVHTTDRARASRSFDDTLLFQEFIPGIEYAPNLYLAEDPDRDVVVVLERTALAAGAVGNALAVRRVDSPDVARLAKSAARALGLRGPVDIDIRRRADTTPVVLEINARFGAHSAYAPEVLDGLLAEHAAHLSVAS